MGLEMRLGPKQGGVRTELHNGVFEQMRGLRA